MKTSIKAPGASHALRPLLLALLSLVACDDQDASGSPCEQASAKMQECFDIDLEECDDKLAEMILDQSCEELAQYTSPDEKMDGSRFCFLWWLCDDEPAVQECAAAGTIADYDDFGTQERLNYHFEWTQCTEYGSGNNPPVLPDTWELIERATRGIVTAHGLKFGRAFTNSTDELDEGRVKLFHTYGTVAKMEFIATPPDPEAQCNVPYTGVWAEERTETIARLSWGSDPIAIGYLPGIALKFFIEGRDSANFHANSGLAGDRDIPHFFEQPVSNILDDDDSLMGRLAALLGLFVERPRELGLTHIASFTSDGERVADPVVPWRLTLEGTDEALELYNPDPKLDFRDVLGDFPVGTPIYKVFAQAGPDTCFQPIGVLTTTSRFVASGWGDEHLYFQHSTEDQEPILDGQIGN